MGMCLYSYCSVKPTLPNQHLTEATSDLPSNQDSRARCRAKCVLPVQIEALQ